MFAAVIEHGVRIAGRRAVGVHPAVHNAAVMTGGVSPDVHVGGVIEHMQTAVVIVFNLQ